MATDVHIFLVTNKLNYLGKNNVGWTVTKLLIVTISIIPLRAFFTDFNSALVVTKPIYIYTKHYVVLNYKYVNAANIT